MKSIFEICNHQVGGLSEGLWVAPRGQILPYIPPSVSAPSVSVLPFGYLSSFKSNSDDLK